VRTTVTAAKRSSVPYLALKPQSGAGMTAARHPALVPEEDQTASPRERPARRDRPPRAVRTASPDKESAGACAGHRCRRRSQRDCAGARPADRADRGQEVRVHLFDASMRQDSNRRLRPARTVSDRTTRAVGIEHRCGLGRLTGRTIGDIANNLLRNMIRVGAVMRPATVCNPPSCTSATPARPAPEQHRCRA
jgi:hypothetical protein